MIFCTPEYNFGIPGGLKNAIDWVSRLPNQPFANKPVMMISAAAGILGGGRMQYDLRRCMIFLDALTMNLGAGFEFPMENHVGVVQMRYVHGLTNVAEEDAWFTGFKTQGVEVLTGVRW